MFGLNATRNDIGENLGKASLDLEANLEDTYLRWIRHTDDALRAAFDAYDAAVG